MRRRRGRGEGAIFRRGNGVWVGEITAGYGGDARRKRRTVYGPTKAAVLEQLAHLRTQVFDGTLADAPRMTTADFLARWLRDVVRTTVGPKTHELYTLMVNRHIASHLG